MNPRDTIRNYGLIKSDVDRRVTDLVEKPESEEQIMKTLGFSFPCELDNIRVLVNTAGYLLNNDKLSKILKEDWVVKGRNKKSGEFDMAGSFIKGLVKRGYPVYVIPIDNWGDFGQVSTFLDTFPEALSGYFPSVYKILESRNYSRDVSNNVWIHNDTMSRKYRGKSLEKRITSGEVRLGPNVFVGRNSAIENGVEISFSDLEKNSHVGEGATLEHAYLSPYCQIGPYTYLGEGALGLGNVVNSSKKMPSFIYGRSVTGPNIIIPEGTKLNGVTIFPGFKFGKR